MAMLRFGSLLVIVLLTVPMVRECCLPPAQVLPCHGTSPGGDESCVLNQQAIIPVDSSNVVSCIEVFSFPIIVNRDDSYPSADLAGQPVLPHPFIPDINLRTGSLLI
jgi:hypothetical protein